MSTSHNSASDAPPILWLGGGTAALFDLFAWAFTGNLRWWLVGVICGVCVSLVAFGVRTIFRNHEVGQRANHTT
ncbi:hypothetical protein ABZY36_02620 [Streptomyces sp. NPDC006627]|uniref:hypothetical protein n=1 Tax=Streptomyces sp. NPDC006627 TaxID=3154679 RepID=UPI0033B6DF60